MKAAALALAARGWLVFPLLPRGKKPLPGSHGHLEATIDPATIERWWTRIPDANIGVRTGIESGVLVLDRDDRNGGEAGWEFLEQEHGTIPYSLRVRTGGGFHCYLRHRGPGRVTSLGGVAPGVDLKADGGYVVAPPSVHPSGAVYQWLDEDDARLEDAPAWLLTRFAQSTADRLPLAEDVAVALPDAQARVLVVGKFFPEFERRVLDPATCRNTQLTVFGWQCRCNRIPVRITLEFVPQLLAACARSPRGRVVPRNEAVRAIVSALKKRPGRPERAVLKALLESHAEARFEGRARMEWLELCALFLGRLLPEDEALAQLVEVNERQCVPPLDLAELLGERKEAA